MADESAEILVVEATTDETTSTEDSEAIASEEVYYTTAVAVYETNHYSFIYEGQLISFTDENIVWTEDAGLESDDSVMYYVLVDGTYYPVTEDTNIDLTVTAVSEPYYYYDYIYDETDYATAYNYYMDINGVEVGVTSDMEVSVEDAGIESDGSVVYYVLYEGEYYPVTAETALTPAQVYYSTVDDGVLYEEDPIMTIMDEVYAFAGLNDADTLEGTDYIDHITGNLGDDTILGGAGDDVIWGNGGDRDLSASDNDQISGGKGDDLIRGNQGADLLKGNGGSDTIYGGAGNDTLSGGRGADQLFGKGGADILTGGKGDDMLSGGKGADILNGGAGDDTLTGSSGADTFEFKLAFGHDVITDFEADVDSLLIISDDIAMDPSMIADYAEQVGADVVITLDEYSSITVQNADLTDVLGVHVGSVDI